MAVFNTKYDPLSYESSDDDGASSVSKLVELDTMQLSLALMRESNSGKPPTHTLASLCRTISGSKYFEEACKTPGYPCANITGSTVVYGHEINVHNAASIFIAVNRSLRPRDVKHMKGDVHVQSNIWTCDTILLLSRDKEFGSIFYKNTMAFSPKSKLDSFAYGLLNVAAIENVTPVCKYHSYFNSYDANCVLLVTNICGDERMISQRGYLHTHAVKENKLYIAVIVKNNEIGSYNENGFQVMINDETIVIVIRAVHKNTQTIINESPVKSIMSNNSGDFTVFENMSACSDGLLSSLSLLSDICENSDPAPATPIQQIRGKNMCNTPESPRKRDLSVDSCRTRGIKIARKEIPTLRTVFKKMNTNEIDMFFHEYNEYFMGNLECETINAFEPNKNMDAFLKSCTSESTKTSFFLLSVDLIEDKSSILLSLCSYVHEENEFTILDRIIIEIIIKYENNLDFLCKFLHELFVLVNMQAGDIYKTSLFYMIRCLSELSIDSLSKFVKIENASSSSGVISSIYFAIIIFNSKIQKQFETPDKFFEYSVSFVSLGVDFYSMESFAKFAMTMKY